MATILKVQNLTKLYGSKKGVSDISFDVGSGEIVGLLGPNGAGKTTTVECILGLRDPDSGRIEVNGIDSRSAPDTVRRMMGAQLQSTSLHDSITPRETTRLFASFYSPEPDTDQALKRFGLLPQADTPFRHLSGGQRQRLALTLAFLHNPGLVILDEPSAGLDPASRQDLLDCILAEKNKGPLSFSARIISTKPDASAIGLSFWTQDPPLPKAHRRAWRLFILTPYRSACAPLSTRTHSTWNRFRGLLRLRHPPMPGISLHPIRTKAFRKSDVSWKQPATESSKSIWRPSVSKPHSSGSPGIPKQLHSLSHPNRTKQTQYDQRDLAAFHPYPPAQFPERESHRLWLHNAHPFSHWVRCGIPIG